MSALKTMKFKKICPNGCSEFPQSVAITNCPECGSKLLYTIADEPPLPDIACAMAKICPDASPACFSVIDLPSDAPKGSHPKDWLTKPSQRWMYCYAYKQLLGLKFNRDLGVYIPEKCPHCGMQLEQYFTAKVKNGKRS